MSRLKIVLLIIFLFILGLMVIFSAYTYFSYQFMVNKTYKLNNISRQEIQEKKFFGLAWEDNQQRLNDIFQAIPVDSFFALDSEDDLKKLTVIEGKVILKTPFDLWIYGYINKNELSMNNYLIRVIIGNQKDVENFNKRAGLFSKVAIMAMQLDEKAQIYQLINASKARQLLLGGEYDFSFGLKGVYNDNQEEIKGIGLISSPETRYIYVQK